MGQRLCSYRLVTQMSWLSAHGPSSSFILQDISLCHDCSHPSEGQIHLPASIMSMFLFHENKVGKNVAVYQQTLVAKHGWLESPLWGNDHLWSEIGDVNRGCQPIPGSSRERLHNGQTKTPKSESRIDTQWHPLIIRSGFSQKIIIHEKNYGQWPL